MGVITAYHGKSDNELLQGMSDKRQHSQLIEELCQRIEKGIKNKQCPICEGNIEKYKEEQEA